MPQLPVMIQIVVKKVTTTPTLLYDAKHLVLWPGVLLFQRMGNLSDAEQDKDLTAYTQLYIMKHIVKKEVVRMDYQTLQHEFPPVWNADSQVLVLGSFPSVKSREEGFFYGHPQNRFWKVMAAITEGGVPESVEEKKELLLRNRIAVWDVIQSCRIKGSSDSSIRDVRPVDLRPLLKQSRIGRIYANGRTAERLYNRYLLPQTGLPIIALPSTSPANAAWKLDRLIQEYSVVLAGKEGENEKGNE